MGNTANTSGFFRGRVLDVFITEELIGEETVNNKGDLVIVENRERRLNLEVGDETGLPLSSATDSRPPVVPRSGCRDAGAVESQRPKPYCQETTYIFPVTTCG